jgi:hypothetical protein
MGLNLFKGIIRINLLAFNQAFHLLEASIRINQALPSVLQRYYLAMVITLLRLLESLPFAPGALRSTTVKPPLADMAPKDETPPGLLPAMVFSG